MNKEIKALYEVLGNRAHNVHRVERVLRPGYVMYFVWTGEEESPPNLKQSTAFTLKAPTRI